jgi:hypothetical protein
MLMLISHENTGALYAGIILATIGTYSNISVKIAWFNNNLYVFTFFISLIIDYL